MSVGGSGRIVIEIAPDMKRELHAALSRDGQTLKRWFVIRAEEYIRNSKQLSMFDTQQENTANQTNSSKGK
ncbi:hypothetical protein ACO0K3_04895 [Undibacterium sp. Rencai35W]|uniref:hypothetical protein n=1 Tax=Undibacterium sp. Rencai35W TaxID=3413046 RepID=UPI003BF300F6